MPSKSEWRKAFGLLVCSLSLALAGCGVAADATGSGDRSDRERSRIILLGTAAGPSPRPDRAQPATLLIVDGRTYLIDAGENVAQQLAKAGVRLPELDALFLSHLHFDHVLGLGPLMAYSWIGGGAEPLPIWGPPGTRALVGRSAAANDLGADIFRPQLPPRPPISAMFPVHEIAADGPVEIFSDDIATVSAVANTHYGHAHLPERDYGADKSYSYRFETPAGSIVFTGDTGPSAAVEALARDCDVLVSEIVDVPSVLAAMGLDAADASNPMRIHMEAEHLTPAEVGKLAQRARAKKLVITHFAVGPALDPEDLVPEIRKHYPEGEIVLGRDLTTIGLED